MQSGRRAEMKHGHLHRLRVACRAPALCSSHLALHCQFSVPQSHVLFTLGLYKRDATLTLTQALPKPGICASCAQHARFAGTSFAPGEGRRADIDQKLKVGSRTDCQEPSDSLLLTTDPQGKGFLQYHSQMVSAGREKARSYIFRSAAHLQWKEMAQGFLIPSPHLRCCFFSAEVLLH